MIPPFQITDASTTPSSVVSNPVTAFGNIDFKSPNSLLPLLLGVGAVFLGYKVYKKWLK